MLLCCWRLAAAQIRQRYSLIRRTRTNVYARTRKHAHYIWAACNAYRCVMILPTRFFELDKIIIIIINIRQSASHEGVSRTPSDIGTIIYYVTCTQFKYTLYIIAIIRMYCRYIYTCILYRRPWSGLPVIDVHCIIGELQSIVVIAPNRGTTLQRLQLQLQLRRWFIIILQGGRCNAHYAQCAIPSRLFILLLSSWCLTLCYHIRPTDIGTRCNLLRFLLLRRKVLSRRSSLRVAFLLLFSAATLNTITV